MSDLPRTVDRLERGGAASISRKFLFHPRSHNIGSIWALGVSRVPGRIAQKLITPTLKKIKSKTQRIKICIDRNGFSFLLHNKKHF